MRENIASEAEIIAYYLSCRSIKQTARHFGCWHGVVRKMLINNGLYTNATAKKVIELVESGKTVAEIVAEIGVTKTTVSSYLPYTRGTYMQPSESENAQRIRKCREKKRENSENNLNNGGNENVNG